MKLPRMRRRRRTSRGKRRCSRERHRDRRGGDPAQLCDLGSPRGGGVVPREPCVGVLGDRVGVAHQPRIRRAIHGPPPEMSLREASVLHRPAHQRPVPASETFLRVLSSLSPLPSAVPVTFSSTSKHRPCFPPEVRTDTGRLRSTGSGVTRSPASPLLCSPPTPLLLRPSLWFPSRAAYPEAGSFLVRLAHAPADAPASEIWVRVSVLRPVCSWRTRALPGFWVVLFAPAAI